MPLSGPKNYLTSPLKCDTIYNNVLKILNSNGGLKQWFK